MSTKPPVFLPAGITTVSDTSSDGNAYTFAGTAPATEPMLQFIGTHNFSPDRFVAASPLTRLHVYGAATLDNQATVELGHGVRVTNGTFSATEGHGSRLTLDGNSTVNNDGTLSFWVEPGTGRRRLSTARSPLGPRAPIPSI